MQRILVVDDSATARAAIRRLLESLGFASQEAADGEAALGCCRSDERFDAILLDIDMPGMDGITFLARLRATPTLPQPPVVMCSSHTSLARIREALGAGANEYIMKPFDAEILGSKLTAIGLG